MILEKNGISLNEFNGLVGEGRNLVCFSASWCGPCKILGNTLNNMDLESIEGTNSFKMDIDSIPDIVSEYGIRSVPTLILFENGEILKRESGVKSEMEITKLLNFK